MTDNDQELVKDLKRCSILAKKGRVPYVSNFLERAADLIQSMSVKINILDAECAQLKAQIKSYKNVAIETEVEIQNLHKKVYVPGLWRCAKCNFELVQSNLYTDGTVTARDATVDTCPNCNKTLWRVSERERHHTLMADCERFCQEAQDTKLQLENAQKDLLDKLKDITNKVCENYKTPGRFQPSESWKEDQSVQEVYETGICDATMWINQEVTLLMDKETEK